MFDRQIAPTLQEVSMPAHHTSPRPTPLTSFALVLALLAPCAPAPAAAARPGPESAGAAGSLRADERYGRLPMAFEPNLGQSNDHVRFLSRGSGYTVFVTADEAVLALAGPEGGEPAALRMKLAGAREPRVEAERQLEGRCNYLTGEDESKWLRDVPTYAAVRWSGVYEGVDAVFYGTQSQLEYDFVVAPGADPSAIRVRFEGQQSAEIDEAGELVLKLEGGEVRQLLPAVFQKDGEGQQRVAARCVLTGDGEIGFEVGEYDPSRPLVVDPALVYARYLAGTVGQVGRGVAVDASGAAYVTGYTSSTSFPTTAGAYDGVRNGGRYDVFVTKLSAAGNALTYSTYLGGGLQDEARAIAVDASGAACVTGRTASSDFPTTPGVHDGSFNGGFDAFVTKLSATGATLAYSTLIGGSSSETGTGIAVDASGLVYVTGDTNSSDFPASPGSFDSGYNGGSRDAFVAKLSATGATLTYSTFLGESVDDIGTAIAVDASGAAYVTGHTTSTSFPTTAGSLDRTFNGHTDAFVTKLSAAGNALVYSSFLGGGAFEVGNTIAIDASGAAYVGGHTESTNLPTTAGAPDTTLGGTRDGFATKLSAAGSALVYSTYLGGDNVDHVFGIAVDASGAAYVTGATSSSNFPVTAGAFEVTLGGSRDAFATKLSAAGDALVYSTFLGGGRPEFGYGIAVDASGAAYLVGQTESADFPTASAFDTSYAGGLEDAYVTKLSAAGSALAYSTYLGGGSAESGYGIAVDATGAAYITGSAASAYLLIAGDPIGEQFNGGVEDAFVTKIAAAGNGFTYSTYLGGSGDETATSIAVDASGAIYVVGETGSTNFPVTAGSFDTTHSGDARDAFVTKLVPDGTALAYSTFLGGISFDTAGSVAVDASGAAYVAGTTASSGFPTTAGALDTTMNGVQDAFVTKLVPNGSGLAYSTFLGGSTFDTASSIAIDSSGSAYVTGLAQSTNFPTTPGAVDATHNGGFDAFVTKLAANGTALVYSTFVGGTQSEDGQAIAIDASGAAYVTGTTESANFPTTPGAFDTTRGGATDAFVTKLSPAADALVYSTYLGGSLFESGYAIAVDAFGQVVVAGETASTDYPTTPGAVDTTHNGGTYDVFVTKLTAAGAALVESTYLGGSGVDACYAIAAGAAGAVYVTGLTTSPDFPTSGIGFRDGATAFVAKLMMGSASGSDTVGVYLGSTGSWFLRNSNSPGGADVVFGFGPSGLGWAPLSGDWDGDGDDTPALYDPTNGFFFLRNSNSPGPADTFFGFGPGGLGWRPLAGDWDGDGDDTIGLYDPSSGFFYIRNTNAPGGADAFFGFGPGGLGWQPIVGDWDCDGDATIGLYDPSSGFFYLRNANAPGGADTFFGFGPGGLGWRPIVGDWDGDGGDTIGLYDPSSGFFYIRNANAPGGADSFFGYGPANATPLVGDWDGQ
jgi:hypothetical protein